MYTTLNKLLEAGAPEYCKRGWNALLNYVGKTCPDDAPIAIHTLLDAIGVQGTLWAIRTFDCGKDELNEFLSSSGRTEEEIRLKLFDLFNTN